MIASELADALAIRHVMERYMRYNDDRRLDAMLTVFADDATFRVGGVVSTGHAEIREFLLRLGYADDRPAWHADDDQLWVMPRSAHVMSNPVIDVNGDAATAECDFVVIDRDEAGHARIVLVGRYRDRFRRLTDGRWVIADRVGVSMARRDAPPDAREPIPVPASERKGRHGLQVGVLDEGSSEPLTRRTAGAVEPS